jgi:hypothetical protein
VRDRGGGFVAVYGDDGLFHNLLLLGWCVCRTTCHSERP